MNERPRRRKNGRKEIKVKESMTWKEKRNQRMSDKQQKGGKKGKMNGTAEG